MTHDELLAKLDVTRFELISYEEFLKRNNALRAVVELHKPVQSYMFEEEACSHCSSGEDRSEILYPCPTIQTIEKELK
jgi:hypothetical protein